MRHRKASSSAISAVVCLAMLALGCKGENPPDIPYGQRGEAYHEKIDFAKLEHDLPLTPDVLARITPEQLKAATQEEVDQIYARLTAGPIPDGPYDGQAFFPKGSSRVARGAEIVGSIPLTQRVVNFKIGKLEDLAETVWKGKVFYKNEHLLRNRINDLAALKLILGDTGNIQKISVDSQDAWLLFPAKLYCGQSLLDGRRESIIIDYAYTDELPGYREMPDALAGRDGLQIRDEIRMIRPGFYLGRAYTKRVFLLNFLLINKDAEQHAPAHVSEDCWVGTQRLAAPKKT